MRKISNRHFWNWFIRHQHEFHAFENKPKKEVVYWMDELNMHLRGCSRHLGFTMEFHKKNDSIKLTITAQGKIEHFKKAEALVAAAPVMQGWVLFALERPREIDFLLHEQMKKTCVDPREFCFCFDKSILAETNLIIYHSMVTEDNMELIYDLAHEAVYNLLGERNYATEINSIELANLSMANDEELIALEMLPQHLGLQSSGVYVDNEGNLVSLV